MRLQLCLISMLICGGVRAGAQTPSSVPTPTCAELHLVPEPRECSAVTVIPIGDIGFFVAADGAEDGFAAEDLTEKTLGKRQVEKDVPLIRLERAGSAP